MGSDTSKPELNNQLHLRLDRQPKWSNNDVQMPTIRSFYNKFIRGMYGHKGVYTCHADRGTMTANNI